MTRFAMKIFARVTLSAFAFVFFAGAALAQPVPLLKAGTPVDWWFVFKFNAQTGPGCTGHQTPSCIFGGGKQDYADYDSPIKWGQHYAVASKAVPTLTAPAATSGNSCAGNSTNDPIGATFSQIYKSTSLFYVVWNDQFYGDPLATRASPAGHSKGVLAWDSNGDGVVMQVSTPSWPASGSKSFPRKKDGNTLGCVDDNDVMVSQHFFALKLNKDDVVQVLKALVNASVVTASKKKPNKQIVKNGGPQEIQDAVNNLGPPSGSGTATIVTLSTGVRLISKPSNLLVPSWPFVSAMLKSSSASSGPALRVANWWTDPDKIENTTTAAKPKCWATALATPGAVTSVESGTFDGKSIGLLGGPSVSGNHGKFGVTAQAGSTLSIFGDLNQQGTLAPKSKPTKKNPHPKATCDVSQNARGGTFYVVDDAKLHESLTSLLKSQ